MRTHAEIAADLRKLADELTPVLPEPNVITVSEGGRLQEALNTAPVGAIVELLAGLTYPGNFVIRKSVTLRTKGAPSVRRVSPDDAPLLARLEPVNGAPLIDILPGVRDVSLVSLALHPADLGTVVLCGHDDSTQTTREQQPRDILLRGLLIDGRATAAKRAIELHCDGAFIAQCHIAGIKRIGQEAQAIAGWNGAGNYIIRDNYLEAGAQSILFGGDDPSILGLIPENILIQDNTLTKDEAWRGTKFTVKNHFELKAARKVVFERNTLEHCWKAGQDGYSILLTPQSQQGGNPEVIVEDVQILNNTIRDVSSGMQIMGYAQINQSLQTKHIRIENNRFQISKDKNGGQGWAFFLSREPKDIAIGINTIETDGDSVVFHEGAPVQGFQFVVNLVPRCGAYGFSGKANGTTEHRGKGREMYLPNGVIAGNCFGSFPKPHTLTDNLHVPTANITLADGYGTGAFTTYGRQA